MAERRTQADPIFGSLLPDRLALDYIYEREKDNRYKLVATTHADDASALELEARLRREHGAIVHYMHGAWRAGQAVGINLYFADGNPFGLTDNEEQLVADLAAQFSEEIQDGKNPSMEEYMQALPNEPMRRAFRIVANMTKFITITHRIKE